MEADVLFNNSIKTAFKYELFKDPISGMHKKHLVMHIVVNKYIAKIP